MLKFDDGLGLSGPSELDDVAAGRDTTEEIRRQLGYDVDDGEPPVAEELDEDFLLAPDESHVQAFRLIEREGETYIDVRFKPNGNSGVRQYRYFFGPGMREAAQMIFHEMSGAAHPGVDIWAYLIRGGVPYEETAVS